MGARRRKLSRVDRGRLVHRDDAEGLQALRPLQHLAHDARALVCGLEAVAAQAGNVQQHVRQAVIRNDEAVALGNVEPLDGAAEFDHARGLVGEIANKIVQCVTGPGSF